MNYCRTIAAVVAVSTLLASNLTAGEPQGVSIKSLNWLIGNWSGQGKRGVIGERWKVKDSLTFDGAGYHLNGSDTVVTERTQMIQCDSGLFFVADVPENKSKVWFKLTSADSLGFLFENPKHDFPTKVCYRKLTNDSLSAWVEGPAGDKPKRIGYSYTRRK